LAITDVPNHCRAQPLIQSLQAVYAARSSYWWDASGAASRGLWKQRRLGVRKVFPKSFTRNELLPAAAASLAEE